MKQMQVIKGDHACTQTPKMKTSAEAAAAFCHKAFSS
jgi:hypothetical protein